ncbi:MAG: hypothetical protein NZ874_10010 [Fimbriimonadales bacterium]|nr:hypothetical protein [Fimbriimonadales bacterium]
MASPPTGVAWTAVSKHGTDRTVRATRMGKMPVPQVRRRDADATRQDFLGGL